MQMLTAAVKGLDRLDQLVPVVQELGKRHVAYGVADCHYDTVDGRPRTARRAAASRRPFLTAPARADAPEAQERRFATDCTEYTETKRF
jgi:hypothetical protein